MKQYLMLLSFIFLFVNACSSVPITGRSRLLLSSESEEVAAGAASYKTFLSEAKISKDAANGALVKKVGEKIAKTSGLNYDWEFTLVENDEANAFCLPGGKVAVYTGILKYTKTEAGLATVMSHEIAHAVARHGAERASQAQILQLGLSVGDTALNDNPNKDLILQGINVAGNVGVILPYSRKHESEADYMGLILMSKAGYNPNEAIAFWQRMSAGGSGKQDSITKFLSTHPTDEQRIKDLQKHLKEALTYYNKK